MSPALANLMAKTVKAIRNIGKGHQKYIHSFLDTFRPRNKTATKTNLQTKMTKVEVKDYIEKPGFTGNRLSFTDSSFNKEVRSSS